VKRRTVRAGLSPSIDYGNGLCDPTTGPLDHTGGRRADWRIVKLRVQHKRRQLMAIAGKDQGRPTHVEEAIQAMTAMHDAHHAEASRLDRLIDRITATVARSNFLIYVVLAIALWFSANSVMRSLGTGPIDVWPFSFLSLLVSCTALLISVLILASQRRADRLANLREQMTLEMVLLTTQKVSKLIDLMEELRRDSPDIKDRVDLEAIEMADMPDHDTVLTAIQEINAT
jgi:uncharacterized membrane protein